MNKTFQLFPNSISNNRKINNWLIIEIIRLYHLLSPYMNDKRESCELVNLQEPFNVCQCLSLTVIFDNNFFFNVL